MTRCVRLWGVNCPAAVCRREFFLGGGGRGLSPLCGDTPCARRYHPFGAIRAAFFCVVGDDGGMAEKRGYEQKWGHDAAKSKT